MRLDGFAIAAEQPMALGRGRLWRTPHGAKGLWTHAGLISSRLSSSRLVSSGLVWSGLVSSPIRSAPLLASPHVPDGRGPGRGRGALVYGMEGN